ncbi:MAG: hypothetical protein FWF96_02940, partial [Kiritimatiellaeota bacterium]|nr:hypothetical protein [Kiritimatiellota bacterium]
MNKLVTAAALALTMGASVMASECGELPELVRPCKPIVYDLNISVKTTNAKVGKIIPHQKV